MNIMQSYPQEILAKFLSNHSENLLMKKKGSVVTDGKHHTIRHFARWF